MSALAAAAREAAMNCEVKKHSLRQTQDGVVISFVFHPEQVPNGLQLARLGTRYIMALVELGDDELPVTQKLGADTQSSTSKGETETQKTQTSAEGPPAVCNPLPADKHLTKAAAMLCKNPRFWLFCRESGSDVRNADQADAHIKAACEIASKKEILPGTVAEQRFSLIKSTFVAWDNAPRAGL